MIISLNLSIERFQLFFPEYPIGGLSTAPKEVNTPSNAKSKATICSIYVEDNILLQELLKKKVVTAITFSTIYHKKKNNSLTLLDFDGIVDVKQVLDLIEFFRSKKSIPTLKKACASSSRKKNRDMLHEMQNA